MAIELLVTLTTANAPSATAWNNALLDGASPARLEMPERIDLLTHTGFVPVALGDTKSGFYFSRESYSDAVASYPALNVHKVDMTVVYSLGYGGDFKECAAAFYAATVLVSKFGGTAFDTEGGTFISLTQLLDAARLCQQANHVQ